MKTIKDIISSTVYSFGNMFDQKYGSMVLRNGGDIVGDRQFKEKKWKLIKESLHLIDSSGKTLRILKYIKSTNSFLSVDRKMPFYLFPILHHEKHNDNNLPKILINSIPKSGTYFLDRILSELGWRPTQLHLLDWGGVDDYRGLSDDEMHQSPESHRVICPPKCLGSILGNGDIVAGHIKNNEYLYNLISQGIIEIRLTRNLRNVIVSMSRFKIEKNLANVDDNISKKSDLLLNLFKNDFAGSFSEIKEISNYFDNSSGYINIRFEDVHNSKLEGFSPLFELSGKNITEFNSALDRCKDKKTSTWSGKTSIWENYWSEEMEELFISSGFFDLNKKMGYE